MERLSDDFLNEALDSLNRNDFITPQIEHQNAINNLQKILNERRKPSFRDESQIALIHHRKKRRLEE